jgi:hypothetical protein
MVELNSDAADIRQLADYELDHVVGGEGGLLGGLPIVGGLLGSLPIVGGLRGGKST